MSSKFISNVMKFMKHVKTFDGVLEKVKILELGNGKCLAELKVDESHTNVMGDLHTGFSVTLVDCISSFALMTQTEAPHVSVDMHISYMKGARIDDEIIIDANVLKTGKTLAFLEVEIKNKNSGDLLVKGAHTTFIMK